MSFIGYLRPLVQGETDNQPALRRPVAGLAAGFTLSAVAVTGLVHLLGTALLAGLHLGTGVRLVLTGIAMLAFLLIDTGKLGVGTPMWQRQTPQRLFYMFGPTKGALLWGLDTGLMVTTFRVTSLTWAALAASFTGMLPWWSGIAYAAGFVIPSAVFILLVPARHAPGVSEPHWVMDRVSTYGRSARNVAPAVYIAAAAACVTIAVM